MRAELTKKDIWLLKLAGSVLIVFLMVRFLVMPGITRYQDTSIQSQMLDETIQEMKLAIDSIPEKEKSVEKRLEELETAASDYYGYMENRQVDELLTGLALEQGLFPVSLSINAAAPGIPAAYLYSSLGKGESDAAAESVISAAQDSSALSGYVQIAVGNMVLRGSREKVFAFIDEIERKHPAVQIWALQMNERTYLNAELETVEEPDVSLTLAVYMVTVGNSAADSRRPGD